MFCCIYFFLFLVFCLLNHLFFYTCFYFYVLFYCNLLWHNYFNEENNAIKKTFLKYSWNFSPISVNDGYIKKKEQNEKKITSTSIECSWSKNSLYHNQLQWNFFFVIIGIAPIMTLRCFIHHRTVTKNKIHTPTKKKKIHNLFIYAQGFIVFVFYFCFYLIIFYLYYFIYVV